MQHCPKCGNSYPDTIEFCMHDGTRLAPAGAMAPAPAPPGPPKKGCNKILLGCLIAALVGFGGCVVLMIGVSRSPDFKKKMAEDRAREEQAQQQRAERDKQDRAATAMILAALHNNFPSENSRQEMTCAIGVVEKSLDDEAGESRHLRTALYADRDLLARFAAATPAAAGAAPDWPWLTHPALRDWQPGGEAVANSTVKLQHRYVVVFMNQGFIMPELSEKGFIGGDFRGWAVLFDADTLAVIGQTEVHAHSTNHVKYGTRGPKSSREYMEQAVNEDFRDQFKESLNGSMDRMCPKLTIDVSLP